MRHGNDPRSEGACAVTRFVALLVFIGFAWPAAAAAKVERFAVIVGNDAGRPSEARLKYANSDARKVYDTLRDLGEFASMQMVLLNNDTANTVRSTLIAINDRIRASVANPNTQVVLFVYYSGHADDRSLHLGNTDLTIEELSQLVRGSAATFRLLVLDACRSGALTRVRGGRITAPFPVATGSALRGTGLAFITASSATEDAQESDELRGGLFTHALVSGLAGAADQDGDGSVVIEEAYRYAYDTTLRLTSRTRAGLQHPTFHYDFRGQGRVVLTRPRWLRDRRGLLHLPENIGFLVMRGGEGGAVVAELGPGDAGRALALPPGRYFVLGRGADHVLETKLELHAGQSRGLRVSDFERVEYARLVRRGGSARAVAHSIEAGARGRSATPNAERGCFGGYIGYSLDLDDLGVLGRLGVCRSGFDNEVVSRATTDEVDLELRLAHAWDWPAFTLHAGGGAGAALFWQRFDTRGRAPDRISPAFTFHVAAGATIDVTTRYFAAAELEAQTYLLRMESQADSTSLNAAFALRASAGFGLRL